MTGICEFFPNIQRQLIYDIENPFLNKKNIIRSFPKVSTERITWLTLANHCQSGLLQPALNMHPNLYTSAP